jgi:branched-chain amino acid transport system ATP-binding protein
MVECEIFQTQDKILSETKLLLNAMDVSIVFGGLCAVSDFSCELYQEELVGLIGPNGAGKTTLFNILSGVYSPTSGEITFWDKTGKIRKLGKMSPAQLNRAGIARTFQNIRLFGNLTVLDNVLIALHYDRVEGPLDAVFHFTRYHCDEFGMRRDALELLSLFKIDNKQNELAKNLSYGEQRRLEISRALASNPVLLLLDEPAAGMNPQETQELMKMIGLIREKFHLTILLIEHDMHLVMGICERLMVLDYGRLIAKGPPQEIRQNEQVIRAYLGADADSIGGGNA